jgi:hypothetical protein
MKSENYSYNYKKLSRHEVETILSKKCNLTLRDYINILNSTNNLKLLSLQQISNNFVCPKLVIKNISELLSFIHSVSGDCIIKCINNKDWYRLAFVNLKINQLIYSMSNTKLLFKRALTNGVYSADYINIYLHEDLEERKSLLDLINIYKERFEKINIDKIKNKDFRDFVKETLSMFQTLDQKILDSLDIEPILFAMLSTLSLINIYESPLLDCQK